MEGNAGEWDIPFIIRTPFPPPPPAKDGEFLQRGGGWGFGFCLQRRIEADKQSILRISFFKGHRGGGEGQPRLTAPTKKGKALGTRLGGTPALGGRRGGGGGGYFKPYIT